MINYRERAEECIGEARKQREDERPVHLELLLEGLAWAVLDVADSIDRITPK